MNELPPPGWYDDPIHQTGSRWWDGSTWSELWRPETPEAIAAASTGGAPGDPRPGSGLGSIGPWLSEVFGWLGSRVGHLFTLAVFVLVPISAITGAGIWFAVRDVVIEFTDDTFTVEGAEATPITLGVVAVFALTVANLVYAAAVARQALMVDHGQPEGWSATLSYVSARLGRILGASLLLFVIFTGLIVAMSVVFVISAVISPALVVIVGVAALWVTIWLAMRLSLATTAAAVGPKGSSMIRQSWDLSSGYSWGLLGRAMLVGLMAGVISSVGGAPLAPLAPDPVEFDDTLTSINLADVMGGTLAFVVTSQVISALTAAVGTAISGAGFYSLYRRLGGRLDLDEIPQHVP